MNAIAPVLVFAWGNPSRGDDALGPLFAQRVRDAGLAGVECLEDFQLQPEHALDLIGREHILFVDASLSAAAPFETALIGSARDAGFTSHALSPQALLQVYADMQKIPHPPATLLAIAGVRYELGEPPTAAALAHLDSAWAWALPWLTMRLPQPMARATA